MAPTPAAVVDARYCATHAKAFELTETPWNDFTVRDAGGSAVMRVEGSSSFLHRYLLLDISAGSGRPVLTVERSPTFYGIGRTWEAYKGNRTNQENLLFVAVQGPSLFTRADIHVQLAGRGPNFVVGTSGFSSREYTVSRGGVAVAQINLTSVMFAAEYSVSVNACVDHAFILAHRDSGGYTPGRL